GALPLATPDSIRSGAAHGKLSARALFGKLCKELQQLPGPSPTLLSCPQDVPNVGLSIAVFHAGVQEVAYRLSSVATVFRSRLKILKVILCRDFLAFDIVHHYPRVRLAPHVRHVLG